MLAEKLGNISNLKISKKLLASAPQILLESWSHQKRAIRLFLILIYLLSCDKAQYKWNKKHVYRQNQGWTISKNGTKLIKCCLIIRWGIQFQDFDLILSSSVGLWEDVQFAGEWVPEALGFESWCYQRKTTFQLTTTTNVYIAKATCESQSAVKSTALNAHSS